MIDERHKAKHWVATKGLVTFLLSVLFAIILVIPFFYNQLSGFSILGFPLGFFLFSVFGLVVMVGFLFWMALKQDKIDRKYGASENI